MAKSMIYAAVAGPVVIAAAHAASCMTISKVLVHWLAIRWIATGNGKPVLPASMKAQRNMSPVKQPILMTLKHPKMPCTWRSAFHLSLTAR